MKQKISTLVLFIFTMSCALAQEDWKNLGADELFQLARTEAFDGDREKSRAMLRHILENSPDYADVRILLARTYAWDGQRDQAREQLSIVLAKSPKYQDAISAMVDVLSWDDDEQAALDMVNQGLKYHPNDQGFILKKSKSLKNLGRNDEALATVNQLLRINPAHQEAIELRESIKSSGQRYSLGLRMAMDRFSRNFTPAYYAGVQLGRSNDWGASIVRVNYSNRFEANGLQYEVDLYPAIADGLYAYLNYGYSESSLFPAHRIGAELFKSLPKSLEASLGLRHMQFTISNVTIYTGSVGWYYKNYWFSLRPFITPDKEVGTSFSARLSARYYLGNADSFVTLIGGMGYSPDVRVIQSASGFSENEIYALQSQLVSLSIQKLLRYNLVASCDFDMTRQELSFDVGSYVWITSIIANLTYRF